MPPPYRVKPGDTAKIINTANGKEGPSFGRIVRVHADRPNSENPVDNAYVDKFNALNDPKHYCPPSPYEKEHTRLGKIWPCESTDGKPFMSEHGGIGMWIDVPDQWLERQVTPPSVPAEKKRELTE